MQPTNPNQFTEKAWAAIARTPDVVKAAQQQQIEPEHLLKAILEEEGLASLVRLESIFKNCAIALMSLSIVSPKYRVLIVLYTWAKI